MFPTRIENAAAYIRLREPTAPGHGFVGVPLLTYRRHRGVDRL